MELALIHDIKRFGLEKTAETYKLSVKEYERKVLIKYSQIDSPMGESVVQDSRGIILEKDTWRVMSLGFRKFFNSGEGHAAKIDWSNALILEKLDGTFIQLYWDWIKNAWCVGTTGTAEGEGEVNNKYGTTFADLFWSTVRDKYNFDVSILNKGFCFIFELTTPYNIVVTPHSTSSVALLTVRELKNLQEISRERVEVTADVLGLPVVKVLDINASNVDEIITTLEGMPFTEEGYVVVDANFNRIKIKNPKYLAVHHLKNKTAEHAIMEIVKSNEIEEFAATFPERKDEIDKLYINYQDLRVKLETMWDSLVKFLPRDESKESMKVFAMEVLRLTKELGESMHSGCFFSLKDKKINSVNEYLVNMDNKKLYQIL